jgi:hypothetical protein
MVATPSMNAKASAGGVGTVNMTHRENGSHIAPLQLTCNFRAAFLFVGPCEPFGFFKNSLPIQIRS